LRRFVPAMNEADRAARMAAWHRALDVVQSMA
jgi:hypothetical protein